MNKRVLTILVIVLLFAGFNALAQKTTVYIVRHAEKNESNPDERDPELTQAGTERAAALAKLLADDKIAAIYSTNYKRTMATGSVLAKQLSLTIQFYKATDFAAIASTVQQEYKGKNVLVIGHSNTVPEIVKAFGVTPVPATLTDDDYDFLYKVVIDEDGKAIVTAQHFGEKHHVIP